MSLLGSGSSVSTKPSGSQWQKPIAGALSNFMMGPGGIGQGLPSYPGAMVAPLIPEMEEARQMLAQFSPEAFDVLQNAAITRALEGRPSYDVSPSATAKYFQAGVANPMLREFDRSIRPRIEEAFAGGGGLLSSRRAETQSRALEDLAQNLSSQLAQVQMSNQVMQAQLAESAAGRQLQGVGMAETQARAPLARSQALQAAASPFQQLAQQKEQMQYQEWLRTQPAYNPLLQMGQQFLQTPQTVSYASSPFWQELLLAGVGAAGPAAGAFYGGASGGTSAGLTGAGPGI